MVTALSNRMFVNDFVRIYTEENEITASEFHFSIEKERMVCVENFQNEPE
jgi:hypothetical protein